MEPLATKRLQESRGITTNIDKHYPRNVAPTFGNASVEHAVFVVSYAIEQAHGEFGAPCCCKMQ